MTKMEERAPGAVLASWKEIAAYIGKGVRTVQRWERELGLPVRRPSRADSSTVLAFSSEIDNWIRTQGVTGRRMRSVQADRSALLQQIEDLQGEVSTLKRQLQLVLERTA